jgi:protein ImuB
MVIAHAQALVPKLHVWEATPDDDESALRELARWAIGYSPVVAVDPPNGLWIDIAGVAHLFGSEEKLLEDLVSRLTRRASTPARRSQTHPVPLGRSPGFAVAA